MCFLFEGMFWAREGRQGLEGGSEVGWLVQQVVALIDDDAVEAMLRSKAVGKGEKGWGASRLWGDQKNGVPRRGLLAVPDLAPKVQAAIAGVQVMLQGDQRDHHNSGPKAGAEGVQLEQQALASTGWEDGNHGLPPGLHGLEGENPRHIE